MITPTLDSGFQVGFIIRERRKRYVNTLVTRRHHKRRLGQGLGGRYFEVEGGNAELNIPSVHMDVDRRFPQG